MEKNLILSCKYLEDTIELSFDSDGKFIPNDKIDNVIDYAVYESTTYMNVYTEFPDAINYAIYLLKSAKEFTVNIYGKVKINEEEAYMYLFKIYSDIRLEYLHVESNNFKCKFNYAGKLLEIDNKEISVDGFSDIIKSIKNSCSVEKELKIKYIDDMRISNIGNISFYPYIKSKEKTMLFNEMIRATYHLGKVFDLRFFYPYNISYKRLKGNGVAGYWWHSYKMIELDCRFSRDTIRSTFYHEYGHLLYDFAIMENILPEEIKRRSKQIMHCILTVLNNENTLTEINQVEKGSFKKYLLTPTEIFARLFATYMIYEQDLKGQLDMNNFNDYELGLVKPLIEEFINVIRIIDPSSYKCKCGVCNSKEDVDFYAVVPHSEEFVSYDWYCKKCLEEGKSNIKELYKINIDNITDDKLQYLMRN